MLLCLVLICKEGNSGDGCCTTGCSGECCFGVMYCKWYGVCDFVVLTVVEVCANYGGVNVFHVCLNLGVVYGVGVCVNVCVVVCLFLTSGCCLLCCDVV